MKHFHKSTVCEIRPSGISSLEFLAPMLAPWHKSFQMVSSVQPEIKSLLKKYKITRLISTHESIRILNKAITTHFRDVKRNQIRSIKTSNGGTDLWKAERLGKNLNLETIPVDLYFTKIIMVTCSQIIRGGELYQESRVILNDTKEN